MRVRIILALFVLAATSSLTAQTFCGTVLGTVTDASGAVISGANGCWCTMWTPARSAARGPAATAAISIPELPGGTYTVTISHSLVSRLRSQLTSK